MKKYLLASFCILLSGTSFAQDAVEDFFSDIVEEEKALIDEPEEETGFTARKVFKMAPKKEGFSEMKAPRINHTDNVVYKKSDVGTTEETAPFGLYWGATLRETEDKGVYLRPYDEDGEITAYEATGLSKPIKNFSVVVDFGDSDELWKITAKSEPSEDDAGANKILTQYKKFYSLLEKKYGIAKEEGFEAPNVKAGEEGYLEALKSGEAKLASSFIGSNVNASIEVKVSDEGKPYMILKYVSTKITKSREEDILDAL